MTRAMYRSLFRFYGLPPIVVSLLSWSYISSANGRATDDAADQISSEPHYYVKKKPAHNWMARDLRRTMHL